MTLVLALAAEHEVHMTCDFKLTDARTGAPMSFDAHKLVAVYGKNFHGMVGVTGLAVLENMPIGSWIARQVGDIGSRPNSLEDLFAALSVASEPLAKLAGQRRTFRRLTFVVAAVQGSQSVVALVSNFQDFRGDFIPEAQVPDAALRLSVIRPSSPRLVVAGAVGAVKMDERKSVERLLRAGIAPERVRRELADLNRRAAKRTPVVSSGCYAATTLATGNGATEAFLVEQDKSFMPVHFERMLSALGLRLIPGKNEDGSEKTVQFRGSTSVVQAPSEHYFREQFKLTPESSELWNNYGAYLASSGKSDKAMEAYEKAFALSRENFVAARNLAVLTWHTEGDSRRVRSLFEEVLRIAGDDFRSETLTIMAQLMCDLNGLLDEARSCYEAAIAINKKANLLSRYGHFLLECVGDVAAAVENFALALRLDSNDVGAIIGRALHKWRSLGDLDEARAILGRLLDAGVDSADVLLFGSYFEIVAGEYGAAEVLIDRLVRSSRGNEPEAEGLRGYIALYKGVGIFWAEEHFVKADRRNYVGELAITKWAQGKSVEAASVLQEVEREPVQIDSKMCFRVAEMLVDERLNSQTIRSEMASFRVEGWSQEILILDALLDHPDLPPIRRASVEMVLDAVR